jgi:predicted MFS family arabinose efflux permease
MSLQTMSLSSGLANAAYAVGTVLAVQFAQHLPQRRMLVGYATLLVIGSVLAAAAQDPGMYIAGPRASGPLHEPAADRRRAAAGDRLSRPASCAPRR